MDGYKRVILQSKIQKKIARGVEPLEAFESVRRQWGTQLGFDWRMLEFDEETETIRVTSDEVAR